MSLKKVDLTDGLSLLRHLLDRSAWAEGGAGWFRTLAETTLRPGERPVMAVLAGESGTARAGLPLVEQPGGVLRALTAPYTTRYGPIAADAAAAEDLGRGLRRIVPALLQIDALDAEDPAVPALLRGMRAGGLAAETYRNFANWRDRLGDFDSYWAERPSELQNVVRRKLKRLERAGTLRIDWITTPGDMPAATSVYEAIYAKSWKEPEPDPDFIARMTSALAMEGSVRLAIAYIEGDAAAAQIWLVRKRHATIFKLAHVSDQDRHSPGTLLTYWMLRQLAQTERIETIDFGRGDDNYKRQWMSACGERLGLIAANPRSIKGIAAMARHIWPMRAKRLVRAKPVSG
jgi:hypothetical protein